MYDTLTDVYQLIYQQSARPLSVATISADNWPNKNSTSADRKVDLFALKIGRVGTTVWANKNRVVFHQLKTVL